MIELRNLTKVYKRGKLEVKVLRGISLSIKKGEYVSIMAPSGAGKSTLMNVIGCLDTPTSGSYLLDGEEVGGLNDSQLSAIRNNKIGFIFQAYNLLSGVSAINNVLLPLIYRKEYPADARERAEKELQLVGLGARITHTPGELSGGEQQRVTIARALICGPSILLADEPTGNLDSKSGNSTKKNHPIKKNIKIGWRDEGFVEIKEGLKLGDEILIPDKNSSGFDHAKIFAGGGK